MTGSQRAVKQEAGSEGWAQRGATAGSRAESTRLTPSSQGHRKGGRTGERRAFWVEETACAKALRHERGWCGLKVRKRKEAGSRPHGGTVLRRLGVLSFLGTQPLPTRAPPHTMAAPRTGGVLLRWGGPLHGSARTSLRLLQGQHHSSLFHPAGYRAERGVGVRAGPRPGPGSPLG